MDGASAGIFKEMTRQTIIRKIERLSTGELIDLLGHLIIRERQGPHF
jgi:RNA-binding protein YhbY